MASDNSCIFLSPSPIFSIESLESFSTPSAAIVLWWTDLDTFSIFSTSILICFSCICAPLLIACAESAKESAPLLTCENAIFNSENVSLRLSTIAFIDLLILSNSPTYSSFTCIFIFLLLMFSMVSDMLLTYFFNSSTALSPFLIIFANSSLYSYPVFAIRLPSARALIISSIIPTGSLIRFMVFFETFCRYIHTPSTLKNINTAKTTVITTTRVLSLSPILVLCFATTRPSYPAKAPSINKRTPTTIPIFKNWPLKYFSTERFFLMSLTFFAAFSAINSFAMSFASSSVNYVYIIQY